ncbi:MAG: glycosyltransferase family 2 protein [Planctomycetaceae bacterium]|nr:glycosyltransferase family 2 protein [Planctomycetaceae bacterium]
MTNTLSILMPVYNEQCYLTRIVERVLAVPVPGDLRKELIIVNDASKDRTAEVIRDLCASYPEIRAFNQPVNKGKGAAIRRAVQEMTGQYAIIQDADLEYDPNDYAVVLKPLVEGLADAVYGSRFATREMRRIVHYHHKLGNLFLTHLSNFMTGLDLTDMETCYKAFRADLLKTIPLRSNRFGIEPEITAKLARRRAVVYEVPISYHGRDYAEGKKIGWRDGVSAIWTILKYAFVDDCDTRIVELPENDAFRVSGGTLHSETALAGEDNA